MNCPICGEIIEECAELHELHYLSAHGVGAIETSTATSPPLLAYRLMLPDGYTEGRYEAAQAFVEALTLLRALHPDKEFDLLPFLYKSTRGEDPALTTILAIEHRRVL